MAARPSHGGSALVIMALFGHASSRKAGEHGALQMHIDGAISLLQPTSCTKQHLTLCEDALSSSTKGTFSHFKTPDGATATHVATGDIPDMWIRDSCEQLTARLQQLLGHLSHAQEESTDNMRVELVGALRAMAFFILQDPYANSFRTEYVDPNSLSQADKLLGRGGWVATRNFELDSSAYFLRFMQDTYEWATPLKLQLGNLYEPHSYVHNATKAALATWKTETHHSTSPYSYPELPNDGRGSPVQDGIGLIWSEAGPSDNMYTLGYSIAANVFAAVQMDRLHHFSTSVWKDAELSALASGMTKGIKAALSKHGRSPGGQYCFSVDGKGGCEESDDANVPSLLSLTMLDPNATIVDSDVAAKTRAWALSKDNPMYVCGEKNKDICGIGSIHETVGPNNIWPMSWVTQIATSKDASEVSKCVQMLLTSASAQPNDQNKPVLHEALRPDDMSFQSRPNFAWVNSMYARYACDSCWQQRNASHLHTLRALRKL